MPKVDLYNMNGDVIGDVQLCDNVFGIEVNDSVLHTVVINQLANKRQGTQSTKTVSEVRGGGRKPWRQKGTGRARQGSIRSAQWVGGGVALGPKPRSYRYELPKKVRRLALKSALSSKVVSNDIIVLDKLELAEIKTKAVSQMLNKLQANDNALIVVSTPDSVLVKSARNIPGVKTAFVNSINTYDILKYNKFIVTKDAAEKIEEVYA